MSTAYHNDSWYNKIWKSIFGVVDASGGNCKRCLVLRHIRAVVYLGDPRIAPTLPQRDPSGGSVRQDIASDWFFGVGLQFILKK